jgi:hypothetical protein
VGGVLIWCLTETLVRLPLGSGVGANLSVILYGLALIVIVQRLPRGVVPTLVGETVRGRLEGGTLLKRLRHRREAAAARPAGEHSERASAALIGGRGNGN